MRRLFEAETRLLLIVIYIAFIFWVLNSFRFWNCWSNLNLFTAIISSHAWDWILHLLREDFASPPGIDCAWRIDAESEWTGTRIKIRGLRLRLELMLVRVSDSDVQIVFLNFFHFFAHFSSLTTGKRAKFSSLTTLSATRRGIHRTGRHVSCWCSTFWSKWARRNATRSSSRRRNARSMDC